MSGRRQASAPPVASQASGCERPRAPRNECLRKWVKARNRGKTGSLGIGMVRPWFCSDHGSVRIIKEGPPRADPHCSECIPSVPFPVGLLWRANSILRAISVTSEPGCRLPERLCVPATWPRRALRRSDRRQGHAIWKYKNGPVYLTLP
jgi:hypothetical protein